MNTVDVLKKARQLFADKPGGGLLLDNTTGCMCAMGAIAVASGVRADDLIHGRVSYKDIHPAAVQALSAAMPRDHCTDIGVIIRANDRLLATQPLGAGVRTMLGYFDAAIASEGGAVLDKGTRIILVDLDGFMECAEQGIYVGSVGTVVGVREDKIEVTLDDCTECMRTYRWGFNQSALAILL